MSDKFMSVMGELLNENAVDNITIDSGVEDKVIIGGDDDVDVEDGSGEGDADTDTDDSSVEETGSGEGDTDEGGDSDADDSKEEVDVNSELKDILESIKILTNDEIANTIDSLITSYVEQLERDNEKAINSKTARVVAKRISEYKVSKAEELAKELSAEAIAEAERKVTLLEGKLTAIEIDSYVKEYNVTAEILKATGKTGDELKSFVELHPKRDSSAQAKRKSSVEDIDSALVSMLNNKNKATSEEEENAAFASLLNMGRENNV